VLLWRQRPERLAWAGLAGFLAGSAVACKYPAILLVVVPLLIYVTIQAGRRRPAVIAVFLVAVSLGCGPWFAKNLALTGNPTYPLLGSWFADEAATVARHEHWQRAHQVPRDSAGYRYSLAQLWDSLSHFAGRSSWQSPLLVPLAIIGLIGAGRRREVFWIAALVAYTFLIWWLLTHRIERFWVPILPLLALLAGLGGERLCRGGPAAVLPTVLLFAMLFGALAGSSQLLGDNRFLVGLEQLRDGPAVAGELEDTHHGRVHRYLNEHLSSTDGKVLLVGDAEPFDLQIPTLYNTCFDESVFEQLMRDRDAQQ
jgi:4-amino-4-deoxy-L-arabinose transferase-like glycosyltransferase